MPGGLKIYLENSRNPLFSRRKHGSNKEEDLAINHYLSEKSFAHFVPTLPFFPYSARVSRDLLEPRPIP